MSSEVVNKSSSTRSRITVCVRLRPMITEDYANSVKGKTSIPDICVHLKPDGQTIKLCVDLYNASFSKVDHTFAPNLTQQEVYNIALKRIVSDVLDGYNGTALVYGQTGSGKTHTMFGNSTSANPCGGMAQLAISEIFKCVDLHEQNGLIAKVYMSFYQIYLEQVYDLLPSSTAVGSAAPALNVREDTRKGAGVFVEDLQYLYVKDESTAIDTLMYGLKNRKTQSTYQNIKSSRSHAILQLYLDFEEPASGTVAGGFGESDLPDAITSKDTPFHSSSSEEPLPQQRSGSKYSIRRRVLTLVDLAGSERVKHYGVKPATKQQLKEAIIINKSISALGNCIQALAVNNSQIQQLGSESSVRSRESQQQLQHVPFRDCKLTRLLAEPLGGNSKTVVIANIGPCTFNYEETHSTLKFAARAMVIKKQVKKGLVTQIEVPPVLAPYHIDVEEPQYFEQEYYRNDGGEDTVLYDQPTTDDQGVYPWQMMPQQDELLSTASGSYVDTNSPIVATHSVVRDPFANSLSSTPTGDVPPHRVDLREFLRACSAAPHLVLPAASLPSPQRYRSPYGQRAIQQQQQAVSMMTSAAAVNRSPHGYAPPPPPLSVNGYYDFNPGRSRSVSPSPRHPQMQAWFPQPQLSPPPYLRHSFSGISPVTAATLRSSHYPQQQEPQHQQFQRTPPNGGRSPFSLSQMDPSFNFQASSSAAPRPQYDESIQYDWMSPQLTQKSSEAHDFSDSRNPVLPSDSLSPDSVPVEPPQPTPQMSKRIIERLREISGYKANTARDRARASSVGRLEDRNGNSSSNSSIVNPTLPAQSLKKPLNVLAFKHASKMYQGQSINDFTVMRSYKNLEEYQQQKQLSEPQSHSDIVASRGNVAAVNNSAYKESTVTSSAEEAMAEAVHILAKMATNGGVSIRSPLRSSIATSTATPSAAGRDKESKPVAGRTKRSLSVGAVSTGRSAPVTKNGATAAISKTGTPIQVNTGHHGSDVAVESKETLANRPPFMANRVSAPPPVHFSRRTPSKTAASVSGNKPNTPVTATAAARYSSSEQSPSPQVRGGKTISATAAARPAPSGPPSGGKRPPLGGSGSRGRYSSPSERSRSRSPVETPYRLGRNRDAVRRHSNSPPKLSNASSSNLKALVGRDDQFYTSDNYENRVTAATRTPIRTPKIHVRGSRSRSRSPEARSGRKKKPSPRSATYYRNGGGGDPDSAPSDLDPIGAETSPDSDNRSRRRQHHLTQTAAAAVGTTDESEESREAHHYNHQRHETPTPREVAPKMYKETHTIEVQTEPAKVDAGTAMSRASSYASMVPKEEQHLRRTNSKSSHELTQWYQESKEKEALIASGVVNAGTSLPTTPAAAVVPEVAVIPAFEPVSTKKSAADLNKLKDSAAASAPTADSGSAPITPLRSAMSSSNISKKTSQRQLTINTSNLTPTHATLNAAAAALVETEAASAAAQAQPTTTATAGPPSVLSGESEKTKASEQSYQMARKKSLLAKLMQGNKQVEDSPARDRAVDDEPAPPLVPPPSTTNKAAVPAALSVVSDLPSPSALMIEIKSPAGKTPTKIETPKTPGFGYERHTSSHFKVNAVPIEKSIAHVDNVHSNSFNNLSVDEKRNQVLTSQPHEKLVNMLINLQDQMDMRSMEINEKDAEITKLRKLILEL